MVINFAVSKELLVSSTFFPRKDIHKQTWISPNTVNKSQINYTMTEKGHKSCIKTVRSYVNKDFVVINFPQKISVECRRKRQQRLNQK